MQLAMSSTVAKITSWLDANKDRFRFTIDSISHDEKFCFLEVSDKAPASNVAKAAMQKGALEVGGCVRYSAKELPEWFHHGTDCDAAINILFEGFKTAGEIDGRGHHPDGVYSYSDAELSHGSMYNQGAIIHFSALGIVLPLTVNPDSVPVGGICRHKRSASKRVGAIGQEYIHHPRGCLIRRMSLNLLNFEISIDSMNQQCMSKVMMPSNFIEI